MRSRTTHGSPTGAASTRRILHRGGARSSDPAPRLSTNPPREVSSGAPRSVLGCTRGPPRVATPLLAGRVAGGAMRVRPLLLSLVVTLLGGVLAAMPVQARAAAPTARISFGFPAGQQLGIEAGDVTKSVTARVSDCAQGCSLVRVTFGRREQVTDVLAENPGQAGPVTLTAKERYEVPGITCCRTYAVDVVTGDPPDTLRVAEVALDAGYLTETALAYSAAWTHGFRADATETLARTSTRSGDVARGSCPDHPRARRRRSASSQPAARHGSAARPRRRRRPRDGRPRLDDAEAPRRPRLGRRDGRLAGPPRQRVGADLDPPDRRRRRRRDHPARAARHRLLHPGPGGRPPRRAGSSSRCSPPRASCRAATTPSSRPP